ncbi:hypothetical protein, partial [Aeromonas caviae]
EAVVGITEASGHQMIAWGESRHEVNSLWSGIKTKQGTLWVPWSRCEKMYATHPRPTEQG